MPTLSRWFIKTALVSFVAALPTGLAVAARPVLNLPGQLAALTPVYFHLMRVDWVMQLIFGVTCADRLLAMMRLGPVSLLCVLLLSACGPIPRPTATSPAPAGVLEGRVTIGPLTPVERAGVPTPTVPPEVYAARSIQVFQADGTTLAASVRIGPDGVYRVELPPGTYVVDIPKMGIERAAGLPTTITIAAGQTTRLDIDIDTGIR